MFSLFILALGAKIPREENDSQTLSSQPEQMRTMINIPSKKRRIPATRSHRTRVRTA